MGTARAKPLAGNPVAAAIIGAGCISSSAIVIELSHTSAGTTAFFRCALAIPGLVVLALVEQRHRGARSSRQRLGAAAGGAFLGIDLVLWAHSIYDVGAGIATVLGNLQVLFVGAIAWALLHERPHVRFLLALPVVIIGVVLVAGLLGQPRFGHHPVAGVLYGAGTSLAYAIYILLLRRNTASSSHVAAPLAEATIGASLSSLVFGLALGQLNFDPSLRAFGWLLVLAVVSQTVGWLLITSALPRLPAAMSSLLLLMQPAASLVLAAVVLSQWPTIEQVAGAVLVCGGVVFVARARAGPGAAVLPETELPTVTPQ